MCGGSLSPSDVCFLRQSFSLFAAAVLRMQPLSTGGSSANRSGQGLPNETDLTGGFKCTLFVRTRIRGVGDVQRKVEMDGKRAKVSNRPRVLQLHLKSHEAVCAKNINVIVQTVTNSKYVGGAEVQTESHVPNKLRFSH